MDETELTRREKKKKKKNNNEQQGVLEVCDVNSEYKRCQQERRARGERG